ncbi:hypothetical protein VTK56DRAFT_3182 [Thermocarpiscus australiensis]
MSPFVAEMRRRVWATVSSTGRLTLDTDFDNSTLKLPSLRPDEEITPILYRIVRAGMTSIVGLILDFTADTLPSTYAAVMKIDQKLEEVMLWYPTV